MSIPTVDFERNNYLMNNYVGLVDNRIHGPGLMITMLLWNGLLENHLEPALVFLICQHYFYRKGILLASIRCGALITKVKKYIHLCNQHIPSVPL